MMEPKRIQRKRTKGWRMPADTVYVGRGTKYGNPFGVCKWRTAAQAKERFGQMLNGEFDNCEEYRHKKEKILQDISKLRGKNLACWCGLDEPCHADVLLELANKR